MSEFEPLDLRPGIPILHEGFWAGRRLMDDRVDWEEALEDGEEDEGPKRMEADGGHGLEEREEVPIGRQTLDRKEVAVKMTDIEQDQGSRERLATGQWWRHSPESLGAVKVAPYLFWDEVGGRSEPVRACALRGSCVPDDAQTQWQRLACAEGRRVRSGKDRS
ncbi:hypothetical protein chiPu_0020991 [Chiloscyllium punctatum]|uniref:Uncharacterized protein n=1 Tax=Chiloscyllium punctatum TaxID=137246 RepID=A0A401RM01_CHIPU|nr:hypothetical protein [Chiloscyllium punctatum]